MRLIFNSANEFGCVILLLNSDGQIVYLAKTTSSRSIVEELFSLCQKMSLHISDKNNIDLILVNNNLASSMSLRCTLAFAKGFARGLNVSIRSYSLPESKFQSETEFAQFLNDYEKTIGTFNSADAVYVSDAGVTANVPDPIVHLRDLRDLRDENFTDTTQKAQLASDPEQPLQPMLTPTHPTHTSATVEMITDLDETSLKQLYDLEIELFIRDAWSKQSLQSAFDSKMYKYFVIRQNEKIIASSYIKQLSNNQFDIDSVGISKSYQNMRFGDKLMSEVLKYIIQTCKSNAESELFINLEVRTSNQKAISLYKKHGFVIISHKKNYYANPIEDAYFMQKHVKTIEQRAKFTNSESITLGIETSCDETGIAIVKNHSVLGESLATSLHQHQVYGGVIPEIAARMHLEVIEKVLDDALTKSGVTLQEIDTVCVTAMPGLVGCLAVGVCFAKGLTLGLQTAQKSDQNTLSASATNRAQTSTNTIAKPQIFGVNHLIGHIMAAELSVKQDLPQRFLGLIVSGGHTDLIIRDGFEMNGVAKFEQIGGTIDDAAGEAFDKVGRLLGLKYPAGASIDKLAKNGKTDAIQFPRPLCNAKYMSDNSEHKYNFSFSGLKTSALRELEKLKSIDEVNRISINDFLASFQAAAVDSLVIKTLRAAQDFKLDTIVIGGGFSANSALRERLFKECDKLDIKVILPEPKFCTDNGTMIANLGHLIDNSSITQITQSGQKSFSNDFTVKSIANCKVIAH